MRRSARIVSGSSAALLVAVTAVVLPLAVLIRLRWAALGSLDEHVDRHVHAFVLHHRAILDTARVLTHLGDPLVVTALALALAAVVAAIRRWRAAVYVLVVRVLAVVVAWAGKKLVDRARPDLPDPLAHAHGSSFPSGHAVGSAALWGSIAVLAASRLPRSVAVVVAVVVPLVVAATRVLLGVHFVSDVVAGLLLGWVCAVLVADAMRLRSRHVDEPPTGGSA